MSIVGECACSDEWFWDGDDLECKRPAKVAGWLVGVIIMAVIAVIVAGIIVIYLHMDLSLMEEGTIQKPSR